MLTRTPTYSFDGKVAVVTGAGSGIGRAIARALVARGATVELCDLDGERIEAVTGELSAAAPGRAVGHEVDVTDPDAVAALADDVFERRGRVDILFNNAGVGHAGETAQTTLEDWRRVLEVNVMGVVHGVHAFLPRLLDQPGGAHIVNTASIAGLVANAYMAPYTTSKHAVVGMSEALDLELSSRGIRVTALCPGIIDTDIVRTSAMRGEFGRERHENLTRLYETRGVSPDVVAGCALEAIEHRRVIAPAPRWQVSPLWLLKRYAPPASRAASKLTMRFAGR